MRLLKTFFSLDDAVTILAIVFVFTGQTVLIVFALVWFAKIGYDFIECYEECQAQLRKLAKDD